MTGEMLLGLSKYEKSPALYLYPWVLVWLVWKRSSGCSSGRIPYDIPVVRLNDFTHPNKIPGKDCPFAIDGERYCFTKQVHRDASGKRFQRKAGKQGAYWKSTSTDINITDLNGKLIGYMRKYTLQKDEDDKTSANWYMEEYRVHDPRGLADHYVLCKIYDQKSCCPKYTDTSIRALTERFIERQLGSHPDKKNSQLDSMNQSQTQFDDSNFPEDLKQSTFPPESILPNPEEVIMQPTLPTSVHRKKNNFAYFCSSKKINKTTLPTSENFRPESILPTSGPRSCSMVLPIPLGLSNEFSMSRDPSGNLNPTESIRPILGPPDYSNGFSMSHDLSGNLNPPESTLPILGCPRCSNEFPMCGGISNDFSMSHDLSGNLNLPESTLLIPEGPCYSNELPMFGGISNGFSMSHDLSGNLNPPESTLPILGRPRCSNEFSMCGGISNDFSMSHDLSGNLNAPDGDGEESSLDCHSQLWNHGNLQDKMEW